MKLKEFCKITGEPQRRIIEWAERGMFTPAVDTDGTGHFREFNQNNIIEIKFIGCLVAMGFNWHFVKKHLAVSRCSLLAGTDSISIPLSDYATLTIDLTKW